VSTQHRDDGACLGVIVRFLEDGPTCAWYHAGGRAAHRRVLESSLKAGKKEADARVERSLYSRAVGYSFNSEKIFCSKDGEVTRVPIVEHVPPDVRRRSSGSRTASPRTGATPGSSSSR
jgi:hypothetical protein